MTTQIQPLRQVATYYDGGGGVPSNRVKTVERDNGDQEYAVARQPALTASRGTSETSNGWDDQEGESTKR